VSQQISLYSDLASDRLHIVGDRAQLQQVITNLVTNAMDAVRSLPPSHRNIVCRTARVSDRNVEFLVADWGPGISEDTRRRAFEAFFTTKEHGLGVGLSIAKSIAELHGGKITTENSPMGGAIFRFRLPTALEKEAVHDSDYIYS
jgi:signal transduction histidine kinase